MRSGIKSFVRMDPFSMNNKVRSFFKPVYRPLVSKGADIYVWSRRSTITPGFIGKRVAVYNGKRFHSFIVRPAMVGYRFGEFSFTKRVNAIHTIYKRSSKLRKDRAKSTFKPDKGKAAKSKRDKNRARKKMRASQARGRRRSRLQLR